MAATPQHRDRIHLLALAILGGAALLWAMLFVGTLVRAGAAAERAGTLVAVYPRGVSETEVLTRVARADGVVVRGTWFGNVWHVNRERPGFSGDLRATGAVVVLPMLPVDLFGMGGCGI